MWIKKQLLEEIVSPINGRIQVVHQLGSVRIEVGGLLQSGGVLTQIWKKGLKNVQIPLPTVDLPKADKAQNVLILGLGGGTVVKLILQKWPQVKITGIEIDPLMVKLAKKYFDLGQISNLKIITSDAIKFVKDYALQPTLYNLIIVDLYLGDQIPTDVKSRKFLTAIKRAIDKNGLVIFNHLFYGSKKKEAEEFIRRLEKVFPRITLQRVFSNLMIHCRP
ncbi:methyltransferase domain-containing protein [Patescibacteria group bacterium]|nr:methyltransferase domain-containing protein [Patescibacteria group bacterium]MBU1931479.1 methyltransferase domain-containing protein [Patescibacteria group bacterium]